MIGVSLYPGLIWNGYEPGTESLYADEVEIDAEIDTQVDAGVEQSETPIQEPAFSLLDLFRAGGPFMYPLLLASVIGMMVVFERFYFFLSFKLSARTFEQDLKDSIQEESMSGVQNLLAQYEKFSISRILSEGMIVSRHDPELFARGVEREATATITAAERGLPVLAAVSTIAPLIGFLGTVSGMIGAFDAIATADSVNAQVVAGGIKEALITTASGLLVGIPALTFFQYFSARVNGFTSEVEQSANHIYKELLRNRASLQTSNERDRVLS